MRIIKVTSCENCPYLKYDSSGRENFYCQKAFKILAYEGYITEWTYVLPDEKTVWDSSKIPEWCPLEIDV
jgi:hypothetical protein